MKDRTHPEDGKKWLAEVIVVCDSRTVNPLTTIKFQIFLKEYFRHEIRTSVGRTSKSSLVVGEVKQFEIFNELTNIDPAKHHLRSMIEKAIIAGENLATFFLLDPKQYSLPEIEKLQWAQKQIKEDLFLHYENNSMHCKNELILPPLHWIIHTDGTFKELYLDDGDEVTITKILSPESTVSNNELM